MEKKYRREFPAGRFLKKELEYIAKTYCDNYKTFYYSTVNGGKDKDCIARKKELLQEMAEHVSKLGDEPRTVEQIEQKIRDEMKRVKKYLIAKVRLWNPNSKRDFDFDHLKDRRRALEEDMRYARAKLEAVTAERDFWMAKIDVLDLERQFWMSELERSLRHKYQ
ncbi:unnamed protein product [Cylicostephanus goldi]|uniref:Uncharacterized protein n=1 Tax=Cylicostephanus goldi TaxID=71465 RepID=A0A3P7NAN1_CYLGO|nr:unnamed protein product [Cylicostephanus goldi]